MSKIGKNLKKSKGQVYTPNYIVKMILNMAHYSGKNILKKHVIDNSCGDGAFLTEIVHRYCKEAKKQKISNFELKFQLETYIHGIEIEPVEHEKCLENLNKIAKKHGINEQVLWDVVCANALDIKKYDGKMDFVLGNPPYVRVHNLEDNSERSRKFYFAQNGMIDLYIVFYEIGLKMLNKTGILGYITPSSFFNSLAGECMRKFLVHNQLIEKLVDLKHYQAFDTTTYTTIVVLNKQHDSNQIEYYQFDEKAKLPYYVDALATDDFYIANKFYFSSKKNLSMLKKVFFNMGHCDIEVKNGYATLRDDVFIGDFDFDSKYIIPVIKASKGEMKRIIYPYDKNGKLLTEKELSCDTLLYEYLFNNKSELLERSFEGDPKTRWYAFGRSQAINDTYKNKIVINSLIRTYCDLKIIDAPSGTGAYSGLYLVGNDDELSRAKYVLLDDDFSDYVSLLGKYKRGGYYTFSSKDIKAYLDYKLAYDGGILNNA